MPTVIGYVKSTQQSAIHAKVATQKEWIVQPLDEKCSGSGLTKVKLKCLSDHCVNLESGQIMNITRAQRMVTISPVRTTVRVPRDVEWKALARSLGRRVG